MEFELFVGHVLGTALMCSRSMLLEREHDCAVMRRVGRRLALQLFYSLQRNDVSCVRLVGFAL